MGRGGASGVLQGILVAAPAVRGAGTAVGVAVETGAYAGEEESWQPGGVENVCSFQSAGVCFHSIHIVI